MIHHGKKRTPSVKGGHIQTMTLRAAPDTVAKIDLAADRNGMCRAYFLLKCAQAGYRALRTAGEMK